jgi:hypothetical protein
MNSPAPVAPIGPVGTDNNGRPILGIAAIAQTAPPPLTPPPGAQGALPAGTPSATKAAFSVTTEYSKLKADAQADVSWLEKHKIALYTIGAVIVVFVLYKIFA